MVMEGKNSSIAKGTPSKIFTDFEAYQFLKQIKSEQQRTTPTPLATITYEALRYLDNRPAAQETKDQIQKAQKLYKDLNLPPQKILQLINDPPQGTLDVQVILGDTVHHRTDEEIETILQISKQVFGDQGVKD